MSYPAKKQVPVPTFLRACHRCHGTGKCVCQFCGGTGMITTGRDIRNNPIQTRCSACFGTKTSRCYTCGGAGHYESP